VQFEHVGLGLGLSLDATGLIPITAYNQSPVKDRELAEVDRQLRFVTIDKADVDIRTCKMD